MQRTQLIALTLAIIGLANCQRQPVATEGKLAGNASDCASPGTIRALKQVLFDNVAQQASAANRLIVPNLGVQSVLTIELPVLDQIDHETGKIACSGRLSLQFPASAASLFGGSAPVKQDVSYSIQPAAVGSTNVYKIEGAGPLIEAMTTVDLTSWSIWLTAPSAPTPVGDYPPAPTSVGEYADEGETSAGNAPAPPLPLPPPPPFDLSAALRRDSALAARFSQLQDLLSNAEDRDVTGQVRRDYAAAMTLLQDCPDRSCIQAWLSRQEAVLKQWQQ